MASNGKQIEKNKSWAQSFRHALAGVALLRTERNARLELLWAFVSIVAAALLHLEWYRWVVLLLVVTSVFAAEALNTAIERAVDAAIGAHYSQSAKEAKDLAAGFVLLIAGGAIISAFWLFGPALLRLL
jgi:diacylglycerol kinase